MLSEEETILIEEEILEQQKTVEFNTHEFTIEHLVNKYIIDIEKNDNDIYVPDYQREFVWDEIRQSKLIESIILGLPIPLIFLAEDKDGRLEIVDGSQRIRTIAAYICNKLKLENLSNLKRLNNTNFDNLPKSRQRKIKNKSIRTIVLSETTTEQVKNDLFERINKGSDILRNMEKRKGIYSGKFTDFIYKYVKDNKTRYDTLAPLSKVVVKRQEHEELTLRFFAFIDNHPDYANFSTGIVSVLDKYLSEKNKSCTSSEIQEKSLQLDSIFKFAESNFLNGFAKTSDSYVSRMLFEALSVGISLALTEKPNLKLIKKVNISYWLRDSDFKALISGRYRSHSPNKIKARAEFVKSKLLAT